MNGNASMLENNEDITQSMPNWTGIDSVTIKLNVFF